jgi:hypothetical protein
MNSPLRLLGRAQTVLMRIWSIRLYRDVGGEHSHFVLQTSVANLAHQAKTVGLLAKVISIE